MNRPPLPEDASYVDQINHYLHDEWRNERDESNHRTEGLRAGISDGSVDSISDVVRQAVLERTERLGFLRRCPCLSWDGVGPAAATTPGEEQDPDPCEL